MMLISLGCYNEIPETGWLKQQTLISHGFGVWKSQFKGPAVSVPGEASLPGLQMASFFLCPHMTKKESSGVSESSGVFSSSDKGTDPIMKVFN